MLATARAQVAAYPTTTFIEEAAVGAAQAPDGFAVELKSGRVLESARLVLAFGITDELPAVPGLAEHWGKAVIHCPYCHGYEFSGQRLGVLNVSPASIHQAALIAEWGPTTFFLNGETELDDAELTQLRARGVSIEPALVKGVHGDGTRLSAVELDSGQSVGVDAIYIAPRTHLNSDIAEQLGCALDDGAFGAIIRTDEMKMTTVPGVYAAGDVVRSMHNVTLASADGVLAGTALHRSLIF